jgi:hypothetical protein
MAARPHCKNKEYFGKKRIQSFVKINMTAFGLKKKKDL